MKAVVAVVLVVLLGCAFADELDPVPGHLFMFSGYDIRTAQSKSLTDAVKFPIFVPSFDMKQTFKRPGSTTTFKVPDQLAAYPTSQTTVTTSTNIFHQVEQFLHEEYKSFSIGIGFKIGVFGIEANYNKTSGYIHLLFSGKDTYAAKGHLTSKNTKFVLGPYVLFPLHSYFDALLNKKIPQCPKTPEELNMVELLVKTYGHVFPTELYMGGKLDVITSVDQSIIKKYDAKWVYEQLSLTFTYKAFDLHAGGFKNKSDINISEIFKKAAQTSMMWEGGDRKLHSNETEKEWFKSIDDYPGLIDGTFHSLSDLVQNDPTKQKNLDTIIQGHINTGKVAAAACAHEHVIGSDTLYEVPGTPFVGSGFDTLRMSPKSSVIQHQYGQNVWKNPIYPTYKYLVPDTVHVWENPESVEHNTTFISMSKSEFEAQVSMRIKSSGFLGLAKKCTDVYVYQYYKEYHNEVQTSHQRSISWYDLELSPVVRFNMKKYLSPYAKILFDRLGKDISTPEGKRAYLDILNSYGDAIITRVTMGGNIYFKSFIKDDILKSVTVEKFTQQSGWSFFGLFGSKKAYSDYKNKVSEIVKMNTYGEVKTEGGFWDPIETATFKRTPTGAYGFNLRDMKDNILDWNEFIKTIKDNPVPIKYEIIPIHEAIEDETVRNNMKTVVQEWTKARLV